MIQCSRPHGTLSKEIAETINLEEDGGPRDYFRMSETTSCPRRLAFARFGFPKSNPFTPQVRSKLQLGDLLHNYIRGHLIPRYTSYDVTEWSPKKDEEKSLSFEKSVRTAGKRLVKVKLVGHFDGILARKNTGTPVAVLEVKSTGANGFRAVVKESFQRAEHYSWSYIKQALRYCAAYNATVSKKEALQNIVIFVYNTDGTSTGQEALNMKDYWFKFDPVLFNQDMSNLAKVELDIENSNGKIELVPRCTDDPTHHECNICAWKTKCWSLT